MGPRLLYALIVGAVIAGALALRIWDPSPVARLRAMVFDTYQQINPRRFDPGLPLRIVDIDEESLKRIGQWPWPRTVLAELVKKLSDNGAAAIGFDMIFPEPDRMSPANALRFWPQSDALAGLRAEVEKLPSNDHVLAEAIGQGPVVLGFIATPEGGSLPQSKAGFAHGGDDPRLFAPAYPGAAASLPELQDKASGAGSLNWLPEHDQIIRRLPLLVRVGDALYPSLGAELIRVAQGASTFVVKASGASGELSFGAKTGVVAIRAGNIEIPTNGRAPDNLTVHASMAAFDLKDTDGNPVMGPNGRPWGGRVKAQDLINYPFMPFRGNFNLVGGMQATNYDNLGVYDGRMHGYSYKGKWDPRYDNGQSPPFYPGYVVDSGGPTGPPDTAGVDRVKWAGRPTNSTFARPATTLASSPMQSRTRSSGTGSTAPARTLRASSAAVPAGRPSDTRPTPPAIVRRTTATTSAAGPAGPASRRTASAPVISRRTAGTASENASTISRVSSNTSQTRSAAGAVRA